MFVNRLKFFSLNYYNHYIIKFISFIWIYHDINLDIVSSYMVFNNVYY